MQWSRNHRQHDLQQTLPRAGTRNLTALLPLLLHRNRSKPRRLIGRAARGGIERQA